MSTPIPDVEAREWYHELDQLEDALEEEGRGGDVEVDAHLHGEGDARKPDDEIDRAAEDLESQSESA